MKKCISPNCERPAYATKEYCHKHYWHEVFLKNKPLYNIWRSMRSRCYDVNNSQYKNYGGRGIKVCDRWLQSYDNFAKDMGARPSPEHSIDRIDNDGDYKPINCRWATMKQQNANRRPETDARSTSISGMPGVRQRASGKWEARGRNGIYIGIFDSSDEAIKIRKEKLL